MKKYLFCILTAVFVWSFVAAILPVPAQARQYYEEEYFADSFWCDNSNYPMVRMHMGYARYDDLSSAYIADQWSKSGVDYTEYVCNIIDVKLATNEPVGTYAAHVLVGTSAYGTRIYARGQDGSWERVDTTGYCEASYNTGWAMKHYFSGQRV